MQQTIARATSRATPNAVSGGRRVVFRNEGIGRERLSSVMLPTNITFGVEVESFYPSNVDVSMLQATLNSCNAGRGWRCAVVLCATSSQQLGHRLFIAGAQLRPRVDLLLLPAP